MFSRKKKTTITIDEFSRAFDKVEDEQGNLVSGGYSTDKDFDGITKEIPEYLKKVVTIIALDDNYPPDDHSVALIAFEDENYALLSVATSIYDNKDSRPTIAYRYFWLGKSRIEDEIFDGIRILANWWYNKKQPEFNWYENSESSSFYQALAYRKKSDDNREEEQTEYKEVRDELTGQCNIVLIESKRKDPKLSPSLPQVKICQDSDKILDFHQQAINLQEQNDKFKYLIWAYGVKRLKNPKQFTLIACSDEDSKNWTEKNTFSNKNSQKIQPRSLEEQKLIDEVTEKVKNLLSKIKKDTSNKIFAKDSVSLELKEFSQILQKFPNRNWEWNDIEPNILSNRAFQSSSLLPSDVRYMALIGLFKPEGLFLWLNWLYESSNSSFNFNRYPRKKFAKQCLELQNTIFRKIESLAADYRQDFVPIHKNLLKHCGLEIANILNQLRFDFNESCFEQVKWLLIDSNSIWSYVFKIYTNYTYDTLMGVREKIEGDDFINKLEEIRDNRKISNQNNENLAYTSENSDSYPQLYNLVGSQKSKALAVTFREWGQTIMPKKSFIAENLEIILIIILFFLAISPLAFMIYLDSSRNTNTYNSFNRKELTIDDNLEKQFYLQQESQKISKSSREKTIRLLEGFLTVKVFMDIYRH